VASHVAVASTCEAIVRVLRANFDRAEFNNATLDFQVYVADNFLQPMDQGVSVMLYRIYHDGSHRSPAGRVMIGGQRQRTKLPVDLHFLLTAWAKTASRQHEIAGWMMRVLEDNPTLPASLLNAYQQDVFQDDEAVEIVLAELSTEDMFHIWEVMIQHVYQLSVPYVARRLMIESSQLIENLPLVRERAADARAAAWPPSSGVNLR
jgi:Pvc16 N-terminal domain